MLRGEKASPIAIFLLHQLMGEHAIIHHCLPGVKFTTGVNQVMRTAAAAAAAGNAGGETAIAAAAAAAAAAHTDTFVSSGRIKIIFFMESFYYLDN